MKRCFWVSDDPLYIQYHDDEWGNPVHDDQRLFEMLNLEGAQAGLSWITVLRKRENYRKAFDNFDVKKILKYDDQKIESLMHNEGIIRNRLKINAVIKNARAFVKVVEEFGSFDSYLWQFVQYKTKVNRPKSKEDFIATSAESDEMSKDLKKRGFTFVGSTICYAFMQAVGMVDDHEEGCFRGGKK